MKELFSIIEIDIRPQHREAYLEAARALIDKHREDPGLIRHEIHVSPENPCHCVVTIAWRDEEALRAHFESSSLKDYMRATAHCVARPSVYRTYSVETEQTLL